MVLLEDSTKRGEVLAYFKEVRIELESQRYCQSFNTSREKALNTINSVDNLLTGTYTGEYEF